MSKSDNLWPSKPTMVVFGQQKIHTLHSERSTADDNMWNCIKILQQQVSALKRKLYSYESLITELFGLCNNNQKKMSEIETMLRNRNIVKKSTLELENMHDFNDQSSNTFIYSDVTTAKFKPNADYKNSQSINNRLFDDLNTRIIALQKQDAPYKLEQMESVIGMQVKIIKMLQQKIDGREDYRRPDISHSRSPSARNSRKSRRKDDRR